MKNLLLGIILYTSQITLAKSATECSDLFQIDFFDSLLSDNRVLEARHPEYGEGYIAKRQDKWIFDQNSERGRTDRSPNIGEKVAVLLPGILSLDSTNPALGYKFETILDIKRDMPLYYKGKVYKTYAVMADKKILVRNSEGLIKKLTLDQVKKGIMTLSPQFLEAGETLNVVIDGEVNGVGKVNEIKGLFAEIYFVLDKDHWQSSAYSNYSHRIIRVPISFLRRPA